MIILMFSIITKINIYNSKDCIYICYYEIKNDNANYFNL